MDGLGLVSVYHAFHNEEPGKETRPTYYHRARAESGWHVEYCFMPRDWALRVRRVEIGADADWSKYSDHMPVVVDVDAPNA